MKILRSLPLLVALSAFAADPPLFVLRGDATSQGIVRYDGAAATPFASFVYRTAAGPEGRLALSAFSDRIVAEGTAYFEFDAASGQLLRRYPALGARYGTWTFHGQVVTKEAAARLDVAPGVYGLPFCPSDAGPAGPHCLGSIAFPGYGGTISNVVQPNVLLRRELDEPRPSVAKVFPDTGFNLGGRLPALDVARGGFWFTLSGGGNDGMSTVNRLTFAPLAGGTIGEESTVRETIAGPSSPNELHRVPLAFASGGESLFTIFDYYRSYERRVVRATGTDEQTLMRVDSPPSVLSGVTALAADPPPRYTQLVPAIADAAGANGTHWRSDVWMFNPSSEAMTVTIGRISDPSFARVLSIPAKASEKLTNAVAELGGGAALDALIIDAPYRDGAQLSVYSRTYTPAPDGGTYGQAIPAVPSAIGYSNHLDVSGSTGDLSDTEAALLILDKRDPGRFRHNLGIVNTTGEPMTFTLRYALVSSHASGDPAREPVIVAAPHAVTVKTIESLFPSEMLELLPPRIQLIGERPAAVWLSMVDNITGDASFVPFSLYAVDAPAGSMLTIPAVAHTPGAGNTQWRTDVYTAQQTDSTFHGTCTSQARLQASPGARVTEAFPWTSFWYTQFNDVARQFCDGDDIRGALDLRSGSWMSAWARVYTTATNGGTFGEMLPLFPPRGWPVRHFGGIEVRSETRVNVGLYNGFDAPATIELRLYTATGTLAATRQITLTARESNQQPLRALFGDLPDGLYALSVMPLDAAGCWPYVSTVDNTTGDPTNWW